jgi:hypothetical protein
MAKSKKASKFEEILDIIRVLFDSIKALDSESSSLLPLPDDAP